ncbi:MAG TPA: hypothetical protein VG839_01880, partial [Asticcacaulis sp.]|nr:hypothetical protein [Asticcacaulis sp.]
TPPAIHAPAKPCADYAPVGLTVGASKTVTSPDCRWAIFWADADHPRPAFPVSGWRNDNTPLIDLKTNKVVATFFMEESSMVHWLKDDRHLIINYFDGSGAAEPLAISLPPFAGKPVDLAALVLPDVLRRIHKRQAQVYHYYVYFFKDAGDRVMISAEPVFTIKGEDGPGDSRCLIYSIDKATFRHYRLVKYFHDDDAHPCPSNPDEKW